MLKVKLAAGAGLVAVLIILSAMGAGAHFTMALPGETLNPTADDFMAELGEKKTVWVLWGHPYEHILFNCPEPEVFVRDPEGKVEELSPQTIDIEGKKAWEVSFRAIKRGDYILYINLKAEEHQTFDHLKTIIHCDGEVWAGWDARTGQKAEIIPYLRPYGLEEGFVFSGKALYQGKPMENSTVEVEKYHPKEIADQIVPRAEQKFQPNPSCMYTRVVKTNPEGEFCFTLDEPGIWYIGAYGPEGEGQESMVQRGVIQLPVRKEFP